MTLKSEISWKLKQQVYIYENITYEPREIKVGKVDLKY